jgi:hypothetical protein
MLVKLVELGVGLPCGADVSSCAHPVHLECVSDLDLGLVTPLRVYINVKIQGGSMLEARRQV